ncbi:hypothetical protein EYF80_014713 [Liparis tanakae]|uniref:Uncharacterized protein n=1 Tax=Liparis tanakae TaxID=230148 RepID=A0A4Z2IAF4_9TELE|nr:hypothetical protein EYF80_014713 [Liparis tanakae]
MFGVTRHSAIKRKTHAFTRKNTNSSPRRTSWVGAPRSGPVADTATPRWPSYHAALTHWAYCRGAEREGQTL